MFDTVIIVPYRDRKEQLQYFIDNTCYLIENNMKNSKIVIVEQEKGKKFNRGKLLNIGFKEYTNLTKYFITHDVDINPTNKCIIEFYNKDISDKDVLGIYTSVCDTLGGIIKIQDKVIQTVNGFPNDIWGWGAEDKALQNRVQHYNIRINKNLKNNKSHPEYLLRFDNIDDRDSSNHEKNRIFQYELYPRLSNTEQNKEILRTGLNNIEYEIVERKKLNNIVELLKVKI